MNKPILNSINDIQREIPLWFLRQSGRHIPEYFEIRSRAKNFIDLCLNKDLIVESTKLALKYYDLDAAIIFSDILMIPWAMNRDVKFVKGKGPLLNPMIPNITKIEKNIDVFQLLNPLNDAMYILKKDLPSHISLIGFAGAPWTLSCYMIEGMGSKDFIKTRIALWEAKNWFVELIDTLVVYIAQKLELQARAGADVLMIFDSWSHMIPYAYSHEFGIKPIAKIIELLRSQNIKQPVIGFPFKAGTSLIQYSYESNVDCLALDWTVDLDWAVKNLNSSIAFQGNLDPSSLISENNSYLEENVRLTLQKMKDRKFIFSVGHGLTPDCKIKNVENVIDIVRKYNRDY